MQTAAELISPQTALAGAILATGAAAFTPITILWARRLFPERRILRASWGPAHVVLAALLYFAILQLYAGGLSLRAGLSRASELPVAAQLVALAATQGTVCAVVLYWAYRRDPDGVRSLGLWRGGQLRAALVGAMAYGLSLPGILGLLALWPWLLARLGREWTPQPVALDIAALSGFELWAAVLLAVLCIPLFEELLFRAFLQPVLVVHYGSRAGVALSALIFAALHGVDAFLPLFGLALVLGAVMLRTQRLAAVWCVHALHNGLQVVLLLLSREPPILS